MVRLFVVWLLAKYFSVASNIVSGRYMSIFLKIRHKNHLNVFAANWRLLLRYQKALVSLELKHVLNVLEQSNLKKLGYTFATFMIIIKCFCLYFCSQAYKTCIIYPPHYKHT